MERRPTHQPSRRQGLTPCRRIAHRRGSNRRAAYRDAGITLIEVLVAFIVLMVTVIPLSYLLTSTLASASTARRREAALQLADSWVEILSNTTPPTGLDGTILQGWNTPSVPSGAIAPRSTSVAGTNFTVSADYSYQSVNQTGQSDLCTDEEPPSPNHPGVIQLQIRVTWDNGNQQLFDTTNINYPKPGLQTQGFIAVQVTNAGGLDAHGNTAAQRLEAVNINVSGGGLGATTLSLNPDPNGCAFVQVPPATGYIVAVQQPTSGALSDYSGIPPFVDLNGNTSDSYTETVNVTAETTVAVTYDEGIGTSISYGGASAVAGGVECPGSSSLNCLTLGNGSPNAVAAWVGTSSSWASTTLAGTTTIAQVACTSGDSTCVGVGDEMGSGSTGVILTTSTNFGAVNADQPPSGVTDITSVACPSTNGCYTLGKTSTGPVLLAGAVGQTGGNSDYWTIVAPTSTTFSSLSSLACPTTTTCVVGESASVSGGATTAGVLRLDGDPAGLATSHSWTPTFTPEIVPSTLQSVGQIACPSTSECEATAVGDSTSPSDPTILTASIGTAPDQWVGESTFPTGTGSITGLSCTSSDCVAIGTVASGGPAIWTGNLATSGSPHDWAAVPAGTNGLPTGVSAVTSVGCGIPSGTDTAACVVAATPNSQSAPALLLEGSLTGSWVWNSTTASTSSSVLYYTGVACEAPGSAGSLCTAAGATASGPVVVTASGPSSSSWSVATPSSLPGATVTGIPLETSPATLASWTTRVTQAQAGTSNVSTLSNNLYPLPSGYSIVAGDCSSEASTWSEGSLMALPGGTATVTVPLGLLPLQVVSSLGSPVAGAAVTLTASWPTADNCTADTYTLPTTDPQGFTTTSVPYGTYTYSVNGTTVTGTTVTVGPTSVTVSPGATTYLPKPILVLS